MTNVSTMPLPPVLPVVSHFDYIKETGIYRSFNHNAEQTPDFKKYNLVYGFNGSGKTTITRLLDSFGSGHIASCLPVGCSFKASLSNGIYIKSDSLGGHPLIGQIKVFNTDFIWANLRWSASKANPIYQVGEKQIHKQKRLELCKKVYEKRNDAAQQAAKVATQQERTFAEFKRTAAEYIKSKSHLPNTRAFNAGHLDREHVKYADRTIQPLTEDEINKLASTVQQKEEMDEISSKPEQPHIFLLTAIKRTQEFCLTDVRHEPLPEINKHKNQERWISDGYHYHKKNELTECLLCTNNISQPRLNALASHFNTVYQTTEVALKTLQNEIIQAKLDVSSVVTMDKSALYKQYQPNFDRHKADLSTLFDKVNIIYTQCIEVIEQKLGHMGVQYSLDINSSPEELRGLVDNVSNMTSELGDVVDAHNKHCREFKSECDAAYEKLIAHYFSEKLDDYNRHANQVTEATNMRDVMYGKLNKTEALIHYYTNQVSALGPAANEINELLKAYLGHGEISLVEAEDKQGYEVYKNGQLVLGALSEGEKTALAFCFFISKLREESKDLSKFVVVIDDPISSLDTTAIHSAVGFIKHFLTDVRQLIVLTHNIYFMNEIKRWFKRGGLNEKECAFFMVRTYESTDGYRQASLVKMDKLLDKYDSEYQYLFKRVYYLHTSDSLEEVYHMPNVIRKVKETFLNFKFCTSKLSSPVIQAAITGKMTQVELEILEHLPNTESHAESSARIDILSDLNIESTKKAAKSLLKLIEVLDKEHYQCLKANL